MSEWISANFKELQGKTIVKIEGGKGDEEMIFTCSDSVMYRLIYHQDCCATCDIEDIIGDLDDLIGIPVLNAEQVDNVDLKQKDITHFSDESFTWTFYKIDTVKGAVTIRWYGESNGYYSEEADFERLKVE